MLVKSDNVYIILVKELEKIKNVYYKKINPRQLKFEERIKLLCFQCKHYNEKWTCPPKYPKLDYKKIIREYKNGLIVYCSLPLDNNFSEIRIKSTNLVHKTLLQLEKILFDNNIPIHSSFIGGSCKLCKGICGKESCNNPMYSRIPLEALGINVVSSLNKVGIKISFPIIDNLNRYGLLLW